MRIEHVCPLQWKAQGVTAISAARPGRLMTARIARADAAISQTSEVHERARPLAPVPARVSAAGERFPALIQINNKSDHAFRTRVRKGRAHGPNRRDSTDLAFPSIAGGRRQMCLI